MKRPFKRITRQVSAAALGLISVVALLLSTGLIMFTDANPPLTAVPVFENQQDANGDEVIGEAAPPPLSNAPADRDSTAALLASVLIVLAFVLVWFLVFRGEDETTDNNEQITVNS